MNLSVFVQEYLRGALRRPKQFLESRPARQCTICGYEGRFLDVGPRPEARCPNCSSKERDRIMGLYLRRNGIEMTGKTLLHFSPERPFFRLWKDNPGYVAGDVKISKVANAVVDITAIQFADAHFDYLICHHILEHVPADAKGMQECYRVLKPGGKAFFSVPLDQNRAETWEPPPGMLGVHILGHDAGEIIQAVAIAVSMGATKADFDRTIALHPSTAEELVTMRTPRAG
jgi:SAM-dependent methyltransferase